MPPTNLSGKDELSSGSQSSPHPSSSGSSSLPGTPSSQNLQSLQQHQQKKLHAQSPQQNKPSNLSSKDNVKMEKDDKEAPPKVKQEGQKPTMETQGPPPPPTSQFYLHPSFASE